MNNDNNNMNDISRSCNDNNNMMLYDVVVVLMYICVCYICVYRKIPMNKIHSEWIWMCHSSLESVEYCYGLSFIC